MTSKYRESPANDPLSRFLMFNCNLSSQRRMKSIAVSAVLLNLSHFCGFSTDAFAKMSAERLAKIPEVDLDPGGVFKYVLIRVHSKTDESYVDIVRGYAWAEYHADIYDRVTGELERAGGVDCECLGGGRIKHNSAEKKIHVYGYSMGFGRAKHAVSTEKIKTCYPDYEVTWADEGY